MVYDTNTTTAYEAHDSDGAQREKERGKREREIIATKLCGVLKIVKQFSRPATFKSIKIDLFVMRADPFGIPQA